MVFNFQKFANHLAHTKRNAPDYQYPAQGPVVLVTNDGGSDCEILMSCMFCCMDILSPCDVCINMSPANDSHALGGPTLARHLTRTRPSATSEKHFLFVSEHFIVFLLYLLSEVVSPSAVQPRRFPFLRTFVRSLRVISEKSGTINMLERSIFVL